MKNIIRGLVYIDLPAELALATLKLTGVITWSWSAILAPTWIPATVLALLFIVLLYLSRARIIDFEINFIIHKRKENN